MIVENVRRGMSPRMPDADVLHRIKANTIEKRLLDSRGNPKFHLNFYIVNARREYDGVSMYEAKYAVCTEAGAQTISTEPLLPGKASD